MQSILRKEIQLVENYEEKLKKNQESVDTLKNIVHSRDCWITELESEINRQNDEIDNLKGLNIKLKNKCKCLSNHVEKNVDETSLISLNCKPLTPEDKILDYTVNNVNKSFLTEHYDFRELSNHVLDLKETIVNFQNELSVEKSGSVCHNCCVKCRELINSDMYDGKYFQTKEASRAISTHNSKRLIKEVPLNEKIEEEKILLKKLITTPNLKSTKNVCDKFHTLRGIAETTLGKLLEIETTHAVARFEIMALVDIVNKDIDDYFKFNYFQLQDFVSNDSNSNDIKNLSSNVNCMGSLKREHVTTNNDSLDMINGMVKKVQNNIRSGHLFTRKIKKLLNSLIHAVSEKEAEIEVLQKTISIEQQKNTEIILLYESLKKQLKLYSKTNTHLVKSIKTLNSQLSEIKLVYSSVFHFPLDLTILKEKFCRVEYVLKENDRNESLLMEAKNSVTFFSTQCSLMINYIKNVDLSFGDLKVKYDQCKNNSIAVTQELSRTLSILGETNRSLWYLMSVLSSKPSKPALALCLEQQIVTACKHIHVFIVKLVHKVKAMEHMLLKRERKVHILNKLNANLEKKLAKHANCICKLRSELRTQRAKFSKINTPRVASDSFDKGCHQTGEQVNDYSYSLMVYTI